jgi:hypothetical protein
VIRAHFRTAEADSDEAFEDVGLLLERLSSSLQAANEEIVLRLPTDELLFDVSLYRAATQAKAER